MKLLKTGDAKAVYRELSNIIKGYVVTEPACKKFSIDLTCNPDEIKDSHEKIKIYNTIDDFTLDEIREILKDFKLKETGNFFVDRVIATDDEEIYEKLLPLKKHCEIVHLTMQQDNLEKQGKQVVFINYEPKIAEILPEYILSDFIVNRSALKKIFEIFLLLEKFPGFNEFIIESNISEEIINEIFMFNDKIEPDSPAIRERKENLKNFKDFVYEELNEINSEILKRVDEEEIKIGGRELLEMNANIQNVSELDIFKKIIKDVIDEHIKKISEKFNIPPAKLSEIFEKNYPPEVNEDEIKFLLNKINSEILEEEHGFKVKLARKLAGKEDFLKSAYEKIIELDKILAVIKFYRENNCNLPKISESNKALYFKNAKNLFLEKEPVIPVTYSLGGELETKKVAILTGANSGGKTTLLKTILQMQILAQGGLPVSSEYYEFPLVDEIYFLSKHAGTLNAGAFERTLKDISKILVSGKKKIVLIDELESITEPGAAARMVSSILEMLSEKDDFAVVVTHLSEDILKHIGECVRVDGITATGLDENLNLIVDRQPKFNTIGKSTPELIVEKLYRKSGSGDEERRVYERILGKMKER